MPKIMNDSVLSDDPNSVLRASKYIQSISTKNLDNPSEKPTMPTPDSGKADKVRSSILEFTDKIGEAFDIVNYVDASTKFLFEKYQDEITRPRRRQGAGRFKRGKSSRGYSLPKIPTAEIPKGRYWEKMSDFPYQKRGAGFEGKLKGRMRGGADPNAEFDLGLDEEDEEEDVNVDVEDEEEGDGDDGDDEDEDLSTLTPQPDPNPQEYFGGDFTINKLIDNLIKGKTKFESLLKFFNVKVKNQLKDLPRSEYQDFFTENMELFNQVVGVFQTIIPYLDDLFRFIYDTTGIQTAEKLGFSFQKFEKAIFDVKRALEDAEKMGFEPRRTGAGMMGGVMSGGALGGVPILSSIQQYQRIPTKYLL